MELSPPSSKVRHIWDWSQRWSGPSKGRCLISIWRWSWAPKHWPPFGTCMVIKTLDGSTCKKYIIITSATYIWHTCEKLLKNGVHSRNWNWPIIVSTNTYQFHLSRSLLVYIKKPSSKLPFKAIKIALEKLKNMIFINVEQTILR